MKRKHEPHYITLTPPARQHETQTCTPITLRCRGTVPACPVASPSYEYTSAVASSPIPPPLLTLSADSFEVAPETRTFGGDAVADAARSVWGRARRCENGGGDRRNGRMHAAGWGGGRRLPPWRRLAALPVYRPTASTRDKADAWREIDLSRRNTDQQEQLHGELRGSGRLRRSCIHPTVGVVLRDLGKMMQSQRAKEELFQAGVKPNVFKCFKSQTGSAGGPEMDSQGWLSHTHTRAVPPRGTAPCSRISRRRWLMFGAWCNKKWQHVRLCLSL